MQKIYKENFIKDIKKDLGIKERNYGEDYKLETFEGLNDIVGGKNENRVS